MKVKEELKEVINLMLKDGVKVYAHIWDYKKDNVITYVHFVEGNKIGYVQVEYYGGLKYSTVHKPSKDNGTGFGIDPLDMDSILNYSQAFYVPFWARRYSATPWDNWEDYVNHQHYKNFVEITEPLDKE